MAGTAGRGEAGDKKTGEEIHKDEGAEAFLFRLNEHGE